MSSFEIAKAAFSVIQEKISRKKSLTSDVSRLFREALTETEIYCGRLTRGDPRNYEVEADLARKWSATATIAAHCDRKLSDACLSISRFWANPPMSPEESFDDLLAILYNIFTEKRSRGVIRNLPME